MPPKSKGKGKRGVKQQKKSSAAESQAEATSKRAAPEADSLGEHRGKGWRSQGLGQAWEQKKGWKNWVLDMALSRAPGARSPAAPRACTLLRGCSRGRIPVGHPPAGTQTPRQPCASAPQLPGGTRPSGRGRTARGSGGGCGSWSGRWSRHGTTRETCTKVRERQEGADTGTPHPGTPPSLPHLSLWPVLLSPTPPRCWPAPLPPLPPACGGCGRAPSCRAEHRGDSPGCSSHGRAASFSARAGAELSRGEKPQPEVCGLRHMQNSVLVFALPRWAERLSVPPTGLPPPRPDTERGHGHCGCTSLQGKSSNPTLPEPPQPQGLGSQLGDLLPVPPIVPFSSPWLPEMSRQYRELQRQTAAHSQRLEAKVNSLQEQLATRLQESQQSHQAATTALAERDRTITQLQGRMSAMEREYEQILHASLDLVLAKLAGARQHWEEQGTAIALQHKQRLQEFGLNPLEM
nr:coiled-coil domain-containing protein 153 isoform X2 [Anser cygnoides]